MSSYPDILTGARRVLEGNWREGRTRDGRVFGYTCPDPSKYPDQFFWDSCFHALVWSRIDPVRAMRELRTLVAAQHENGFIGHTTFWQGPARAARAFTYNMIHPLAFQTSTIQPPLLGWIWAEVAERAGDAAFADEGRLAIERFHEWLDRERADADGLIGTLQPDESGLDASPAYDRLLGWRSHPKIGFLALQAFNRRRGFNYRNVVADGGFHATDVLVNSAWVLGWHGLARLGVSGADERAAQLTKAMVQRLYDRDAGVFYLEGPDGTRNPVSTWAGLSPLALPCLPTDIANRVVKEHLLNPSRYWLEYPVPSTAADEAHFVPGIDKYLWIERYWRGPTWLFSSWWVMRGLMRLGYEAETARLADRTVTLVRQHGFREYYNPHTGQGIGAHNFGVATMALECAMMAEEGADARASVA